MWPEGNESSIIGHKSGKLVTFRHYQWFDGTSAQQLMTIQHAKRRSKTSTTILVTQHDVNSVQQKSRSINFQMVNP